jgi:hypothetical protein
VRAYPLETTWYAGANSTNNGSLGWYFVAGVSGNIYNVDWSDTSTSTDAFDATATFTAITAETATNSDIFEVAASIFNAPVTEASTATDSGIAYAVFPATVNESGTALDVVQAGIGYTVYLDESATLTDYLLAGSGYFVSLSETSTATDSDVGYIAFPVSVAEAATVTDSDVGYITFPGVVAESSTATEALDAPGSTYNAQFGGLSLDTSILPLGQSYFGSQFLVPGTAAFYPNVQVVANGTGTGTSGGFNAGGNYILYEFPAGIGGGAEVATTVMDFSNFSSVTIDVIRGNGSNGGNAPSPVNFSVLIVFGGTGYGIGFIGYWDSSYDSFKNFTCEIPLEWRIPGVQVSFSTYTGGFVVSNAWGIRSITLNSIGATATDTTNAPGSTYNPALTEIATATDATAGFPAYLAAIAEAVAATDVPSSSVVFRGFVADTATGADATLGGVAFSVALAETATAADVTAVAASIFNANLAEVAAGVDTVAGNVAFSASVLVFVTISDEVVGAYLWNQIDDTQTANWQNVGTVQASGWVSIETNQVPGWVNIET